MPTDERQQRLWQLADGECTLAERAALLQMIDEKIEWQKAWEEVQLLHRSLQEMTVLEPSSEFSRKVMARMAFPERKKITATLLPRRVKWGLAAGFVLALLVAFWSSGATARSSYLYNYLPDFQITYVLQRVSSSILLVLIVSALTLLLVLDRIVLTSVFKKDSPLH